jgi:hypothetical protein
LQNVGRFKTRYTVLTITSAPANTSNPPTSVLLSGGATLCRNTINEDFMGGGPFAGSSASCFLQGKKLSRAHDSKKVWKPNKTKRKMVMGVDVGLEESVQLSLCTLVGRISYRSLCECLLSA